MIGPSFGEGLGTVLVKLAVYALPTPLGASCRPAFG
jgi:hypothetical protein